MKSSKWILGAAGLGALTYVGLPKLLNLLGITHTPQHPESELRAAGARYESKRALLDVLANHTVVDGRIVTGQNQNAGAETAHKMMTLLEGQ